MAWDERVLHPGHRLGQLRADPLRPWTYTHIETNAVLAGIRIGLIVLGALAAWMISVATTLMINVSPPW